MPYSGLLGGEGASDALTEILAQRRLEARQAMLDDLTRRNSDSEIAARAAQTGQNERRLGLEENKNYLDQADAFLAPGPIPAGTDPRMVAALRSAGALEAQHPTVQSDVYSTRDAEGLPTGSPIDKQTSDQGVGDVYLGTDKKRTELENEMFLRELQNDPKATEEQRNFGRFAGHGVTPPESVIQGMHAPTVFDEASGKFSTSPEIKLPGYHLIERSRPPQAPASTYLPQLYQAPDPEHPGLMTSYWLKPGEQPSDLNKIKSNLFKGGTNPPHEPGSGGGKTSKFVPQAVSGALEKAITANQNGQNIDLTPYKEQFIQYLPSDAAKQAARGIMTYTMHDSVRAPDPAHPDPTDPQHLKVYPKGTPIKDIYDIPTLLTTKFRPSPTGKPEDARQWTPEELEKLSDILNVILYAK